ncbi:MAG: DUF2235 domain-containing protein, partial [Litoreibacter sp.]|nr:DUF2235 domain-containing protein [Litoreibacter sp.]
HVIIFDGTMSSLDEGYETNAGITFRMLSEMAPSKAMSLRYEAGIQWKGFRRAMDVLAGVGINEQIRAAYGFLASRYQPGDRIFFFGFSRGAYAVRSLAGVIDKVGLLRADCATERNVRQAYRHYRLGPDSAAAAAFHDAHCHAQTPIEMIGVWDTVRALGFRAPVLWRFSPEEHSFHSHHLGRSVRNGFQALALNETRKAYEPVLWESRDDHEGALVQMWFPGSHSDVGGHLNGVSEARKLANIPLVWMLERAEHCGLPLPQSWQARLPTDVNARSVGTFRGLTRFFLQRRARKVGLDASETLHPSVAQRRRGLTLRLPWVSRPDLSRLQRHELSEQREAVTRSP